MIRNNIKIAITGGIGSGKSTVADILSESGFNVISLDKVYAELLHDADFKNAISEEFGCVFLENGELDRAKLSEVVFSNKDKLKKLNEITHPRIYERAFEKAEKFGLNFFEVPLLFEESGEKLFDEVIIVIREIRSRIESLKIRDNLSEDLVLKRINSQFNYGNSDLSKYYVIHNDGDLDNLRAKINEILSDLQGKYTK